MSLEQDRARIVRLYRQNPHAWPDGIDSKPDRWYQGHEAEWTEERIARLLGDKPQAVSRPGLT